MSNAQVETQNVKSPANEVVEKLRHKAAIDKTFNAICHIWSNRTRSREQVTVNNLRQTLNKAHVETSKPELENILKFLNTIGIGTLTKSSTGRIRALKGIKWTLQSLGAVSLTDTAKLDNFTQQNKFRPIISKPKAPTTAGGVEAGAVLTVVMDGKTLNFPIYRTLTHAELGFLLADIYAGAYQQQKGNA